MSEEILKIVFGELKKSGVKPIDYDYDVDKFVSDPVEVMNSTFLRGDGIPSFWDFSEHDKPFEDEIAKREEAIGYYRDSLSSVEKNCDKLYRENKELKQRIAELESEKAEKLVAYVLAKEIDGQHYVTVEDFMSVVNNLLRQRAD